MKCHRYMLSTIEGSSFDEKINKIICRGIDWMAGPTLALSHMKYWRDWEKLCICVVLNTKNEITKSKLWPWNRWIVGSWESCSVTCGGGVKERRVYCQQGHNNSRVNYWHLKSRHLSRPVVNIFITFYFLNFLFYFSIRHYWRNHPGGRCHLFGPDWSQGQDPRALQYSRLPQLVPGPLVTGENLFFLFCKTFCIFGWNDPGRHSCYQGENGGEKNLDWPAPFIHPS